VFNPRRPGPDYLLRWPRTLFAQEATALLQPGTLAKPAEIELLFEEAFVSDQPTRDLAAADDVLTGLSGMAAGLANIPPLNPRQQLLKSLAEAASLLPEQTSPRPYYATRHAPAPEAAGAQPRSEFAAAKRAWVNAVHDLQDRGYFDKAAPRPCVDDRVPIEGYQDPVLDAEVGRRIGANKLWTTGPQLWDESDFYSLVEVFHDLIARPRSRWHHDHAECGWHYSDYAIEPGQTLYRWTVNQVLARHHIDLQLADDGDDIGRLVHTPADGRHDLIETALTRPGGDADKVRHAITLFRSRGRSVEDKRSACITLVGVLEARRSLLKTELLSKDEGALFQIANEFAIRHQNARQRPDYDEAYLDWLYWWYLATIELTNQLLTKASTP
jgi:hypothetical protein